jgi:PepSY-associated TM region
VIWRTLVLLHRYLGVAIGALMLVWFASGIVMLYVPYPSLSGKERLAMLEPIAWSGCCRNPSDPITADQPMDRAEVEAVAGVLALRLTLPGRAGTLTSIDAAVPDVPLDLPHARATAAATARRLGVAPSEPSGDETIARDQWTVSGEYNADRPLFRFTFGDREHTQIYVSSRNGRIVLRTTARQRFWNRLGAVPHWLYPTILRSHPRVWSQVVVWTSLVGVFLTAIGLYLGIVQYKLRGKRLISPYAGVWNWHHSLGLLFGIFTLTWVGSGLISMNPWGFLDGGPGVAPVPAARSVKWDEVRTSLVGIAASPAVPNIVNLVMIPLAGDLFWIATTQDGTKVRLDAGGHMRSMSPSDLQAAARQVAGSEGVATATLLRHEDAYYYGRREAVVLPVLRVIVNDPDHTRLYLDPLSGRLLGQVDSDGRWQRWLFDGLHRLDFAPLLRTSVTWSVVVVMLLVGGFGLSATGTYLAVRRVVRDIARLRRRRGRIANVT